MVGVGFQRESPHAAKGHDAFEITVLRTDHKHAFLPAVISYIALLYIVHLEALKKDMTALPKRDTGATLKDKLILWGIIITSLVIVIGVVYFGLSWVKENIGDWTPYVITGGLITWYLLTLRYAAKYPPLEPDDPLSLIHI